MKPITINWNDLELAFDTNVEGVSSYLDTDTGNVATSGLDVDDAEMVNESELIPPRYLLIPTLETADEYQLMERFIASVSDQRLQQELQRSIRGQGAFRRFKDTIENFPAERLRWFAFQDAEHQRTINDWLKSQKVTPANPRDPLPVPGPHNEQEENPDAELQEMVSELSLLLIYLTSWEESVSSNLNLRKAWKGYTFETLNELEDRGLLHQSRKAKSVMLTDEGIALARDLLKRFHP